VSVRSFVFGLRAEVSRVLAVVARPRHRWLPAHRSDRGNNRAPVVGKSLDGQVDRGDVLR